MAMFCVGVLAFWLARRFLGTRQVHSPVSAKTLKPKPS
jgi:hypothetical protein